MPKFVYIRSQFGIYPQLLQDDSVFGVTGDKSLSIVQSHEVSKDMEHCSLNFFMSLYPYKETKDAE